MQYYTFFCQCTNSFRKMDLMKCNNLYWVNKLWVYKLVFISAILKLIIICIIICIIIITIKMVNILLVCNSGGLPFLPQSSWLSYFLPSSSSCFIPGNKQSVIKKGGFLQIKRSTCLPLINRFFFSFHLCFIQASVIEG